MGKEDVFGLIRRRGTLGVLTLCLVGIVAFASYRTSYPLTEETEVQQEEDYLTLPEESEKTNLIDQQETKNPASLVSSTDVTMAEKSAETDREKEAETEEKKETEQPVQTEKADLVVSSAVLQPTVQFSEDSTLVWPTAGTVLMDYSMDGTVYFKTLNEYKYNPALIIGSAVGNPVIASAKAIVESVEINEETGTTVTLNIGDQYELIYGGLKEVAVAEGEVVEQGQLLGYISEPTKYYCEEGSNLYFEMKKDGQIIDPCLYLE